MPFVPFTKKGAAPAKTAKGGATTTGDLKALTKVVSPKGRKKKASISDALSEAREEALEGGIPDNEAMESKMPKAPRKKHGRPY